MPLTIKPKADCRFDLVSLGEVMLRLDPGDGRVTTARSFQVWEGGGEYNVARGLRRCFGLETAVVTAFADNPVGRLVQDFIYQGGVDQSYVKWVKYDGIGRNVRNGLNFTERGFGIRGAVGCSDRGKTTASVAEEAMKAAKKHGTIISYDLNYRESLWKGIGGEARAREVNRGLAKYVDVMLGNEEDFTASLGFEVEGADKSFAAIDVAAYQKMIETARKTFPNFAVVATTLRHAKTAPVNDWSAICYADGQLHQSQKRDDLEIFDRVGGGDSFASGLVYGFLAGKGPQWAVECGAAHGALAMTTPGDTSMATLSEVEKAMKGGGARVDR